MSPVDRATNNRVYQLDLLRGFAILLVLGTHAVVHSTQAGYMIAIAGPWQRLGWSGVDLFFVLSGFLIGGILLREIKELGGIRLKRFFIRRMFKIWPAYYVFLLSAVLVNHFWNKSPLFENLPALCAALVQVQNYGLAYMPHLWSLSVEEHFYVLLPLLLLVLVRFSPKLSNIPVTALLVSIMCLGFRILVATAQPFDPYLTWQTQCRLDGLFFGVFLAYAYEFHREKFLAIARRRKLLLLVAALLLLPLAILRFRTQPIVVTLGITVAYIAYGMLVVALMGVHRDEQGLLQRVLFSRPMRAIAWMGTFSYCIYLFHLDLPHKIGMAVAEMNWISQLAPEARWTIAMTVYFCLAIMIGVIATKVIELPMLSYRNKRFPEDSSPLTSDAGSDFNH